MNTSPQLAKLHAFLFAHSDAVPMASAAVFVGCTPDELAGVVAELQAWLQDSGVEVLQTNGNLQLVVDKAIGLELQKNLRGEQLQLSPALLEVLAIVAHAQPISRGEIDEIRGVGSDQALRNLQALGLVEPSKERHATSTPATYITTASCLRRMGIRSLKEITQA